MQNAMAFNMILNIHERDLLSQQSFFYASILFLCVHSMMTWNCKLNIAYYKKNIEALLSEFNAHF